MTSDNIRHRLHVRRNEHVLSFLLSHDVSAHVLHPSKQRHPSTCQNLDETQSRSQSQHPILVFTCLAAIVRALRITKAEAAPPHIPLPTRKSRASEPNQRRIGPGVSSFTVTSHHRPLTRGYGQRRMLENARPSGEGNKRGFASRQRKLSDERLESGCLRMTGLRNGYWLVKGDGLGGDRAIGTGRGCL